MLSIREFTDDELLEQIRTTQELLETYDYDSGDYNAAKAEYEIAVKELRRRNKSRL